jgi:hypothetical protein
MDQHLRLARDMPHPPFGGLHVIFIGDLYQLPPPGGWLKAVLNIVGPDV